MCYVGPGSVYTGDRHDLLLMSPSGLVTLDLLLLVEQVTFPGYLYVKYHIVLSAVAGLLSFPWQSLGCCSFLLCWGLLNH